MGFVGKQDDNLQTPRFGSEPTTLDRRESVAAVLRRAREKHGQDVRSVAQVLRIRQAYLEALESGRFDRLPGMAYALGFLRTYAEYLGLNANNIVDRFKEEVQEPERQTELVFPEPVAEARIPGGAIILISVVLLGVAYGGWFYLSNQGRSVADLIPALPGQIQTLIEGETDGKSDVEPAPVPESPVVSAEAPAEPATAPQAEVSADAAPQGEAPEAQAPESQAPESQAVVAAVPAPKPQPVEPQPVEPQPVEPQQAEPPQAEAQQAETPRVEPAVPEATRAEVAAEVAPVVVPEPAPTVPEAAALEDAPAAPPQLPRLTRPSLAPQVAAVPEAEDSGASDAYTAPPIEPAPAPTLETLSRADTPLHAPAPVQSAALPEAPPGAPAAVEPQTQALAEPTVVIPAPPSAPRNFAQPGERAPQVYGESNEDARIVLRAIQDSWVQVRDGQDALLLTRVLRSGDVYRVPDQPGLTLLTGNAGGLALEVDGVRLPPLGPIGSVRRQIALDPSALLGRGQ